MELVLQQKQSLNLMMTAELRQAIQLMQYSNYELYQFLQDQQMENPLIELDERVPETFYQGRAYINNRQREATIFDFIPDRKNDMHDDLLEQVQGLSITNREEKAVEYLILNLDENGYLTGDVDEWTAETSMDRDVLKLAINHLQQLEPIGVGARNLRECLLLQAAYYYPEEQLLQCVIRDHLEQLANKKWGAIADYLQISLHELQYIYKVIQGFDPKPCSQISNFRPEYVIPDVMVEQQEDGYAVYLNDSFLPNVQLNPQYAAFLTNQSEVTGYMRNQYKHYRWLINSLEKRRATILRIADVLIRRQHAFMMEGVKSLRPLTLHDVAEEIGMHESTVSRATINKSIQTPQGTFEIGDLFASGLTADNGGMSQSNVKWILKKLVEKESKLKPYSDQKIAEYFEIEQGVTISRRTVAKYRDELKIPSSSKRREMNGLKQ